jgi:hypothetical protein
MTQTIERLLVPVLGIRNRIRRIRMFLGLPDHKILAKNLDSK